KPLRPPPNTHGYTSRTPRYSPVTFPVFSQPRRDPAAWRTPDDRHICFQYGGAGHNART
ncbi:hypothetical protein HPB47_002575, partial [Ixodes persulcatus]